MQSASIKQFIKLRNQLTAERAEIIARLKEVDNALGSFKSDSTPPPIAAKRGRPVGRRNEVSLKDTILKVLGKQQLTKEEILQAVLKSGYRFRTGNPANSINVILYGKKPKFSRKDGKFAAA